MSFESFLQGLVRGFLSSYQERAEEEERRRAERERQRDVLARQVLEEARSEYASRASAGEQVDFGQILQERASRAGISDHWLIRSGSALAPTVTIQRSRTIQELAESGEIPEWSLLPEGVRQAVSQYRVRDPEQASRVARAYIERSRSQLAERERQAQELLSRIQQRATRGEDVTELQKAYESVLAEARRLRAELGLPSETTTVVVSPRVVEKVTESITPGTPAARVYREYGVPTSQLVEVERAPRVELPVLPGTQVQEMPSQVERRGPRPLVGYLLNTMGQEAVERLLRSPVAPMLYLTYSSEEELERLLRTVLPAARDYLGRPSTDRTFRQLLEAKIDRARTEIANTGRTSVNTEELARQLRTYAPDLEPRLHASLSQATAEYTQRVRREQRELEREARAESRERRAESREERAAEREARLERKRRLSVANEVRAQSQRLAYTLLASMRASGSGALDQLRAELGKESETARQLRDRLSESEVAYTRAISDMVAEYGESAVDPTMRSSEAFAAAIVQTYEALRERARQRLGQAPNRADVERVAAAVVDEWARQNRGQVWWNRSVRDQMVGLIVRDLSLGLTRK